MYLTRGEKGLAAMSLESDKAAWLPLCAVGCDKASVECAIKLPQYTPQCICTAMILERFTATDDETCGAVLCSGHTQSWGKGHPELLADCYGEDGRRKGRKGPLDPTRRGTYTLLRGLLQELAAVFPDRYLHLGGDEVSFSCWEVSPPSCSVRESSYIIW